MELLVFGHAGFPVVVFPTSDGRFYEYEERGMVQALAPKIDRGELQLYCVDTLDQESWYSRGSQPADRLHRQNAYDAYLALELTPFVRNRSHVGQFGATGCSSGGYHAMNFALRHPDLVNYSVSMSGAFDIPKRFLGDFYNEDAYFHSPLDYLSNQNETGVFRNNYYVLAVGENDPLLEQNVKLADHLGAKQIPHMLDIWAGFGHDWSWWQSMASKFFL
jgi:esterase/lipase superfamily enzyme